MAYRILLVGGGSGGHVFPLVAVANSLKEEALDRGKDIELIFLGEGPVFKEAVEATGLKSYFIMAAKIRRYFSFTSFWDLFVKVPIGFLQSGWYLFWLMPDAVFTKSGYASFFPVLWARWFFIPVYIHDSDAVPGATSLAVSRWAKKVFVSFESAQKFFPKAITGLVGNPIRAGLLNSSREEALFYFKFSPTVPTVVFLGGSQGAKIINDLVIQAIIQLTGKFQIIHQCGPNNYQKVNEAIAQVQKEGQNSYANQVASRYRLVSFFNDRELSLAYAMADVFISRAGAGSLFELASLSKPAIIIPIKNSSSNHQYYNALEFVKYGGIMLEEDNLVASVLIDQLDEAYAKREEIGKAIKAFTRPEAAVSIAREILEQAR